MLNGASASRTASDQPGGRKSATIVAVNPRMRVALTLEQCWHRVPGGTAVAGIGTARALNALDDVEVVGVAARHDQPPEPPWVPPVEVAHLGLPRFLLYRAWHGLRLPKVQKATGDVDVIHATSIAIPPRSAPLVVTIHDLAFLNDPAHFTKRGLRFFRKGLHLTMKEADLILCPSEHTLRDCRRIGIEQDRLRLVPMGAENRRASPEEIEAARATYGLDRPYILWTGTIEPRKNLPTLIKAFGYLETDVDLVLVGPKGWNEDLQRLLRGSTRDDVKALGFVPHDHLRALYAGAEVFCFPSLFEGFGLPVLEAMLQGTPVVTSKGTSTEEIAEGAGVLVDPRRAKSIARGLSKVLEDKSFASETAEAGLERAARYTWENTARLTLECYREVVG